MKKILLLLFGMLWVAFGCSTEETVETAEIDSSTSENIVSSTDNTEIIEEYISHELNQVEYKVLNTWIEENTEEDIRYYYPEKGMLMVAYDELQSAGSLSDDTFRRTFLDGFISSYENVSNISETEMSMNNIEAYRYDMDTTIDEEKVEISLVILDYKTGVMAFVMYNSPETEEGYDLEFEMVIKSITMPEFNITNHEEDLPEHYFDGRDLVREDFTVTITDYKVILPGESGNKYGDDPVLAFWYDVTVNENVINSDYNASTAWLYSFEAVQDNNSNYINKLDGSYSPDKAHLDVWRQTIKPGGTVSSSMGYKLTDLETPVTLIGFDGRVFGEELGKFNYLVK